MGLSTSRSGPAAATAWASCARALRRRSLSNSKPAWTRSRTEWLATGQTLRARGRAPMKPSALRIERMLATVEAALVPPPRKWLRVEIADRVARDRTNVARERTSTDEAQRLTN